MCRALSAPPLVRSPVVLTRMPCSNSFRVWRSCAWHCQGSSHRLLLKSLWLRLRRLADPPSVVFSRRSVWRHQPSFHCSNLARHRSGSLSASRARCPAQRHYDAATAAPQLGIPACSHAFRSNVARNLPNPRLPLATTALLSVSSAHGLPLCAATLPPSGVVHAMAGCTLRRKMRNLA